MTLGKTVRNLRQAQNLTQEALAVATEGIVSRSYISEIELDKVGDISMVIIAKLAEALSTPVGQLLVAGGLISERNLSNPIESLKEEKTRFLNLIYNSAYLSTEDKWYLAETISRVYDLTELRTLIENQKLDRCI